MKAKENTRSPAGKGSGSPSQNVAMGAPSPTQESAFGGPSQTSRVAAGVRKISSSAMLSEAADRMRTSGLRRLPVVENQEIIGTISDRDIIKAVAAGMDPRTTPVKYAMKADQGTARKTL